MLTDDSTLEAIEAVWSELGLSSLFYVLDTNLRFYSVWSLSHSKVAINEVKFKPATSLKVDRDHFDLMGAQLTSITLTWAPYSTVEDCNEAGKQCKKNFGLMIDVGKLIAELYNFSLKSYKDPDDDWGVRPKSGPYNLSGVWGGVFGSVVNGLHTMSLSQWYYIYERNDLCDFVITTADYRHLALTPQPPEVDTGLFIRPFTDDSWLAILGMTLVIAFFIATPFFIVSQFSNTSSYMIASTSGWYFFVLVNAFYGGALTMFFSSEITIPFEGIRDVIRAYPDWKLKMMDGNDALFQPRALAGDVDYGAFWKRVEDDPEESIYANIVAGLEDLLEGQYVIHVSAAMLRGFFRENPFFHQGLKVFGREKSVFNAIIFTKNSPVAPVFRAGLRRLRERGVLQQLEQDWMGLAIESRTEFGKLVLSPGQVVLVYVIMGVAVIGAIVALILELFWKYVPIHRSAEEKARKRRRLKQRGNDKMHSCFTS